MTEAILEALREPIPHEAIKYRAFQKTSDGNRGKFVPYVQKSFMFNRLTEVIGDSWHTSYKPFDGPVIRGVICSLTLEGEGFLITREGGDFVDNQNKVGDFTLASSMTKSFINAGEAFGIGHELYGLQTGWLDMDEYGRPHQPITFDMLAPTGNISSAGGGAPKSQSSAGGAGAGSSGSKKPYDGPILDYVWPFGKWKGTPVRDIEPNFWDWAFENMDKLKQGNAKFDAELHKAATAASDFHNTGADDGETASVPQPQLAAVNPAPAPAAAKTADQADLDALFGNQADQVEMAGMKQAIDLVKMAATLVPIVSKDEVLALMAQAGIKLDMVKQSVEPFPMTAYAQVVDGMVALSDNKNPGGKV